MQLISMKPSYVKLAADLGHWRTWSLRWFTFGVGQPKTTILQQKELRFDVITK